MSIIPDRNEMQFTSPSGSTLGECSNEHQHPLELLDQSVDHLHLKVTQKYDDLEGNEIVRHFYLQP